MKFGKLFEQYIENVQGTGPGQLPDLAPVHFKELKKLLKECPAKCTAPHGCPACDSTFYGSLMTEVAAAAESFRTHAAKFLSLRQPSVHRRVLGTLWGKAHPKPLELLGDVQVLLVYVAMTHLAVLKIVKKYRKVHGVRVAGAAPNKGLNIVHGRLLHSPLLVEVSALAANINIEVAQGRGLLAHEGGAASDAPPRGSDPARLVLMELPGRQIHMEVDLTCPVCLDLVFDPVGLSCGHLMCLMCACNLTGVPAMYGVKHAPRSCKCPMCRQIGVFAEAITLREVHTLVQYRFPEYFVERRKVERAERVKHAREYWARECGQGI